MKYDYLLNLYIQFNNATLRSLEDYNSQSFLDEFNDWMYNYRKVLNDYKEYISALGINENDRDLFEVGKCKYDSIMSDKERIITPYGSSFKIESSSLYFLDRKPLIIDNNEIRQLDYSHTFYTYNPYNFIELLNWRYLHENNHDISIGVCGNKFDKDMKHKIMCMDELLKRLPEMKTSYDEFNGNYFYHMQSERKTLERVLVR